MNHQLLIPRRRASADWVAQLLAYSPHAYWTASRNNYTDAGTTPVVDSDPVWQTNDQAGTAGFHLLQSTLGNRPTWKATGINGLPALLFDGSDDFMATTSNIGISGNATYQIFAVIKPVSVAAVFAGYFGSGNTSSNLAAMGLCRESSVKFSDQHAGANPWLSSHDVVAAAQVVTLTKAAGAINTTTSIRKNGVVDSDAGGSSANTPNVTNSPFYLGKWATDLGNFGNFYVSDLLVFTTVQSTTVRDSIEAILMTRYGL